MMPTFDFIPKQVQMPDAVRGVADDSALRIQQQGRQAISQGVNQLASAYNTYTKEQDEADMVATRSAVLRVRADEEAELAGLSNKDDIKKVQEKYKTKYDGIIGGNEPLNGKPYFRNQSGKDAFNKGFMENFNTQRYTSGKKLETQLDRRDTHAKYMNGIKSVIDQPNWNTPEAHAETDAYVTSLGEDGFYTPEELVGVREKAHTNLDIERANKMFADIETVPYDNHVVDFQKVVNDYKESINSLDYLDQKEKNAYNKKADALVKNKKAIDVAQKKEFKLAQEKVQNEYGFEQMVNLVEGRATHSQLLADPNIPLSYKKQALTSYTKKLADNQESFEENQANMRAMKSESITRQSVLNYNASMDDNGKTRFDLISDINRNIPDANERTQLVNFLKDGYGMSPQQKINYDVNQSRLSDALGLDVEFGGTSRTKVKNPRSIKFSSKDGKIIIDELDQYERSKANGIIMNNYTNMIKLGKTKEAEEYMNTEVQKIEKTNNDRTFYDSLMERSLYNSQYKGSRQ